MRGINLLLDDHRGVYIPQIFAQDFVGWTGISPEDHATLLKGPYEEGYWDAWDEVLSEARFTEGGKEWTLYQDGALFCYCPELMNNEEYENFFGEMKPAPDGWFEYEVCENCLIALANDDYSGMSNEEEEATTHGLVTLSNKYEQVIADGAEYGFSVYPCECCGALPGNRFRVLTKGETNNATNPD